MKEFATSSNMHIVIVNFTKCVVSSLFSHAAFFLIKRGKQNRKEGQAGTSYFLLLMLLHSLGYILYIIGKAVINRYRTN